MKLLAHLYLKYELSAQVSQLLPNKYMHHSFVTTPPPPRHLGMAGDSRSYMQCFYFLLCPLSDEEMLDIIYIFANMAVQCKHDRLRGITAMTLPAGCPCSVFDYIRELLDGKLNSMLFPRAGVFGYK